uniref:Bm8932 n=1 Tax=Brugia malayi TaxID=6279 RepID=A0A0H5S2T1_BRUMA|nr:Bm8932 [Brugia malayi]
MNGICVQSFEHLATTNDLETLIVPPFKLKPIKFDAKEKINNQPTNTTEFQTLKMAKSDEQSESEELEETETEELSETVAEATNVTASQIPNEEITEVMNVTEFETIIETGTVSDYHTSNMETDSWTLENIYDIGGSGTYWIGLIKDINGTLKWQSDESMIYTNWSEGEPEPRIGCVIINTVIHNGKWSITDCSDLQYPDQGFVCEMDIRNN